jgi:hypothetical protein
MSERRCAERRCRTILSTFNTTDRCSLHFVDEVKKLEAAMRRDPTLEQRILAEDQDATGWYSRYRRSA